jgi:hypothetical protein
MKTQPVLVVLNVPDDTDLNTLGPRMKEELTDLGYDVQMTVAVQRTDGVPAGMVTG